MARAQQTRMTFARWLREEHATTSEFPVRLRSRTARASQQQPGIFVDRQVPYIITGVPTWAAIASEDVRPGGSIPNRLISIDASMSAHRNLKPAGCLHGGNGEVPDFPTKVPFRQRQRPDAGKYPCCCREYFQPYRTTPRHHYSIPADHPQFR